MENRIPNAVVLGVMEVLSGWSVEFYCNFIGNEPERLRFSRWRLINPDNKKTVLHFSNSLEVTRAYVLGENFETSQDAAYAVITRYNCTR